MTFSLRSALLAATCCTLLLVLTSCFSLPVDAHLLPKKFETGIGGLLLFGPWYSVQLENGSLYYEIRPAAGAGGKTFTTKIDPTNEQWKEFRISLDALQVWKWQKNYSHLEVQDGTSWGLTIEYPDHAVTSGGFNGYPDASGQLDPNFTQSKAFRDYCAAVKKLIGDRDFY